MFEEGAECRYIDPAQRTRRTAVMAIATNGTVAEQLKSITAAADAFTAIESRPNYTAAFAEYNAS